MKKNGYLGILVLAILTGIYNVIMFVVPFTKDASFWWAYGATMLAFVSQIIFGFLAFNKRDLKSKFLGFSVFRVGYGYLVLQLIVGFALIILPLKAWISIVVYSIILGFSIIFMIGADSGRSIVESTEKKIEAKVIYIKSIQAELEVIAAKAENALVKQEIKKLCDAVKYSDPMSHISLYAIEEKIKEQVAELGEAVEINDDGTAKSLVSEISKLIVERNQKTKILK